MPNNQQLLEVIRQNQENDRKERLEWQKAHDLKFLELAMQFSDFKNKHEPISLKLLGYMESDKATNQKGVVEQVSINTSDIADMKTLDQVRVGKAVVLSSIGTAAIFLVKQIFF